LVAIISDAFRIPVALDSAGPLGIVRIRVTNSKTKILAIRRTETLEITLGFLALKFTYAASVGVSEDGIVCATFTSASRIDVWIYILGCSA